MAGACCGWLACRFPPRSKFALIIRLLHVKDAFAAEGSDVPFRYVTRRVTEHADVVDMVFWDGSTTEHSSKCALHLYNFPDDFDPRYEPSPPFPSPPLR